MIGRRHPIAVTISQRSHGESTILDGSPQWPLVGRACSRHAPDSPRGPRHVSPLRSKRASFARLLARTLVPCGALEAGCAGTFVSKGKGSLMPPSKRSPTPHRPLAMGKDVSATCDRLDLLALAPISRAERHCPRFRCERFFIAPDRRRNERRYPPASERLTERHTTECGSP
jgi:hypothetical protein